MKKVLIVDDDRRILEKYSKIVTELGHTPITANCVEDGISKFAAENPDAVITDKDMPDGSGNTLAMKIRQSMPHIPIAGITGGDPGDFNEEYFHIRMHKSMSEEDSRYIVEALVESGNPGEYFREKVQGTIPGILGRIRAATQEIIALDILVQGYDVTTRLQRGEKPFPGSEKSGEELGLRIATKEETDSLFDLEDIGIDPKKLRESYDSLREIFQDVDSKVMVNPSLGPLAQALYEFISPGETPKFIAAMCEKRYEDARNPELFLGFRSTYMKMMEELAKLGEM